MISRVNGKTESYECELSIFKATRLGIIVYTEFIFKFFVVLYCIIIISMMLEDYIYGSYLCSKEMLFFGMLLLIIFLFFSLIENNRYIVPQLYIKIPIMLAITLITIVYTFYLLYHFGERVNNSI